ncbi:glutathione hydrolase 5 proenzyme [Athene cunicularia]|uniref:Glutathione hydrolase n=1 Tax=Athene cunicularia TaxID=194338 RepID=A0A663MB58_ATHCN|nr:glutathione hydrolase 5 proenzyme [Athene cunicularia]
MSTGKVCCLVLLTLGVLAVVVVLVVILTQPRCGPQHYLHGAVAADTETCSVIARDILKSGGTAVDAAIAGLICTSVMNPQSSGLGGGVVFTIYNASTGTVEVINARETVPRVFPHNLLSGCSARFLIGSRWIGVPGELRGYEEAHKRYGRLPWKALFEPTIKLLSEPLVISPVMDKMIRHPAFSGPGKSLCPLICDGQRFLKHGETFRWPALQQTLRAVAENGAAAFYEGQIGKALVDDIKKAGSSISLEDLQAYKAEVSSALNITLNDHTTVFSPGPPMGGAVLMFILKILEEYKLHEASLATSEEKVETYHRIAEALKFGNMLKPHMSDPAFSEAQVAVGTILSDEIAELVRSRIDNRGDHPLNHYNLFESLYNRYKSKGTSHISVLAADGSAVSATSTINYPFGSFVYSNQTGIILNNELADFCIANRSIKPGEKPPSAMVPSILISKTGDMLVIGGAGGAWIISATSMAIINKLWFGYDLEHAISAPIMHTEDDNILFEEHFSEEVRSGLLGRGHKEKKANFAMNVVQGISKEGKCISAYSDKRKLGKSAGY